VDARNVLLRPIVHEHQLLGMLQLLNRSNAAAFSAQDVSVINYVAERLAVFLVAARVS
jgi:GAF domain-containing protein